MPRLPKLLTSLLILTAVLPAPARAAPEVLPAVIVHAAVANRSEDYELTIEADREKINPGDQVTFLITFSNRGGLSANDVEIVSWWEFTTDEFWSLNSPEKRLTWLLPEIPAGKTIAFKFTLEVKPTHAYSGSYQVATRASLQSGEISKEAGPIDHAVGYKIPQPPLAPFVFETKNPELAVDKGQLTVDFQRIKLLSPELPFSKIKMYPDKNIGIDIPATDLPTEASAKAGSPGSRASSSEVASPSEVASLLALRIFPESDSGESASEVASLLALRIFPESDSGESASEVASLLAILPIAGKPATSEKVRSSDFSRDSSRSSAFTRDSITDKSATSEDNKSATPEDISVCQFNIDGHLTTGLVQAGTCSGVINTPKAIGFYEVFVRLTDPALDFLETKLFNLEIVRRPGVLDEEGQPISEAEVTLYRFNPAQNKFEAWNTAPSHQENPTVSDEAGEYEFVVPQGKYYLAVKALGFKPQAFEWFEMNRPGPITRDLTLKRAFASKIAHLITKIGRCITLTLRLIWESLIKIPFFRLFKLLGWPLLILLLILILHFFCRRLGLPPWLLLPYLLFLLKRRAKSWGRVLDSETGQPIQGARVKLRQTAGKNRRGKKADSPKSQSSPSGVASLLAILSIAGKPATSGGKPASSSEPGRRKKSLWRIRTLGTIFTNQRGEFGFHQPPGRYLFEIFKRGYTIDTEKQSVNAKPVIVTGKMVMLRWDGETELKILLGEDN